MCPLEGLSSRHFLQHSLLQKWFKCCSVSHHIILNRLRQYSERQLLEEQTGFLAGQGTRDAIFIMQVMIEKLIDLENKELYLIIIDYSKAFDKVDHGRLFDIMLDMGIPKHLVELVAGLYNNQEAAV